MADFLLEIGLEEIPARMIAGAEAELGRRVTDLLTRERLLGADGKVTTFSTPRRLAVRVEGLIPAQPDTQEQLVGPSWKIAFPGEVAGPAAVAFAKKAGVEVAALSKITNAKGEYVGATVERKGRARCGFARGGAAQGSAVDLLGQEYVLARREAGAVGAACSLASGAS